MPFFKQGLTSRSGSETTTFEIEFNGKKYRPTTGGWRTGKEGMAQLISAGRIVVEGNRLAFKRFFADFPFTPANNIWDDISGGIKSRSDPKVFVVQTSTSVVERCLLMTTDPGDLVFDPTCGSGTTAYVAEQWGRRWITCDTPA
jgi:adenine-specific DNA-methyltransferase